MYGCLRKWQAAYKPVISEVTSIQGVECYKVKLMPYDDMWHREFNEAKKQIQDLQHDNIIDIQHFGSKAVPGI